MPLSSALRFFGVWSGPMALAGSRPVYVCLQTIYGLNSGVFPSIVLHMPYPNRGVVWRSIQSVFTRLFTPLIAFFPAPQDMCICMLSVVSGSISSANAAKTAPKKIRRTLIKKRPRIRREKKKWEPKEPVEKGKRKRRRKSGDTPNAERKGRVNGAA